MKNLFRNLTLGLVLASILGGSALAQSRIATIDLKRIVNSYWKKKEAFNTLQDQQTDIEKELKTMEEEFKKMNQAYQQILESANDPAISADEKEKRKKQADDKRQQLLSKKEEYGSYQNRAKLDLTEKQNSIISKILAEIRNVVAARAKTAGYSLVVDSGNEAAVIYSSGDNDLTDQVISDLDATNPAKNVKTEEIKPDKKKK